jgi:4'-phosphopantetheinyl transferase
MALDALPALSARVLRVERPLTREDFDTLLTFVSDERRAKIAAMRHFDDKQRALLGEALARAEILRRAPVDAQNAPILRDEYGKPYLEGRPDFHFCVSHSGRYVVCASGGEPVGVDVETRAPANTRVVERFFARREREYVLGMSTEEGRAEAFRRVWTMKEAYIKLDGRGLGVPLRSFDVFALDGVVFHEIPLGGDAACHVCSYAAHGVDRQVDR